MNKHISLGISITDAYTRNVKTYTIEKVVSLEKIQHFILTKARLCWLRHYATSRKVKGSIPD
jgi:hypothetical protein